MSTRVSVAPHQVLVQAGFRLLVDSAPDWAWYLWSITHRTNGGREEGVHLWTT
jgi:hypothetical protein